MALSDRKHVEAVAILRTVSEQAGFRALPLELQQTVEGWLGENHPPPRAYMNAAHGMAGIEPTPMRVTSMAAERPGDGEDVLLTFSTGIGQQKEDWPFELGSTDSSALGHVLTHRVCAHPASDLERMRQSRDSLTQALTILEAKPGMPACPVCGAEAVRGESQQVTRIPGAMARMRVEPGVFVYLCANGHFHDGERETGPLPEDITIREGL